MSLVIKKTNITFLALMLISFPVLAEVGVAFSSGQGIHGITPYRLSVSWDFGPLWRKDALWGLDVQLENSIAAWNSSPRPDLAADRATDLHAFTSGPLLRWQRWEPYQFARIMPYVELGVGLSWLTQREIQGRVLSLHFQFEDKGGIGIRFGKKQQYDFAIRAYHYSNCSIKRPNSGVNMAMASFGFWYSK